MIKPDPSDSETTRQKCQHVAKDMKGFYHEYHRMTLSLAKDHLRNALSEPPTTQHLIESVKLTKLSTGGLHPQVRLKRPVLQLEPAQRTQQSFLIAGHKRFYMIRNYTKDTTEQPKPLPPPTKSRSSAAGDNDDEKNQLDFRTRMEKSIERQWAIARRFVDLVTDIERARRYALLGLYLSRRVVEKTFNTLTLGWDSLSGNGNNNNNNK